MKMTIKQLSETSGINPQTLRFYRESGILTPEKDENNNYYYYDELDAIDALMAKRNRSMGMQVKMVKESIDNFSANDQSNWISERISSIENQIKLLQTELKHTREIEYYLNLGIEKQGKVELINWDKSVYSMYLFDENNAYDNLDIIKEWSDAMPYTYPTIQLDKDELCDYSKKTAFKVKIGLSCIEENVERCNLPLNNNVVVTDPGLCVRTFIRLKSPFNIYPEDIEPLRKYVKDHNYKFVGNSTGWILSMDNRQNKEFLALIRVKIA